MITLITGGARSGKSTFALTKCQEYVDVGFLATAQPLDAEMCERIVRHRKERPGSWTTYETPLDPGSVLKSTCHEAYILDCITLLVSNLLLREWDAPACGQDRLRIYNDIVDTAHNLVGALQENGRDICVVTNEVGLGLVPDNPLSRLYRDLLGSFNQILADAADSVILMVCGRPMVVL